MSEPIEIPHGWQPVPGQFRGESCRYCGRGMEALCHIAFDSHALAVKNATEIAVLREWVATLTATQEPA